MGIIKKFKAFFSLFKKKDFLKMLAVVAISAVLFVDVGYHISQSLADSLLTLPAKTGELRAGVSAEAYIVRSEEKIYSNMTGNVKYSISDGERVGKNENIAEVYYQSGGSASMIKTLENLYEIRSALVYASRRWDESSTADIDISLDSTVSLIAHMNSQGRVKDAEALKTTLHALLSSKESAVGVLDVRATLKKVNESIANIEEKIGKPAEHVNADNAGWFYYECDGYEGAVSYEGAFSLTVSEAERLFYDNFLEDYIQSLPEDEEDDSPALDDDSLGIYYKSDLIGKLVDSERWYVVTVVSREEARHFRTGNRYLCEFGDFEFEMMLEKAVFERGKDKVLLILSSDIMTPGFDYTRIQPVNIIYETYEGIKIPTSAVRNIDGVCGVYIRRGFLVQYREIEPLYAEDGVMIVKSDAKSSGEYYTLSENDNVIVRGSDLYVGRIIQ